MKSSQDVLRLARVRVSARALVAPADGSDAIAIQARNRIARQSVKTNRAAETIAAITGLVELSSRYAWPVILTFLLLAIVSGGYFTRHFVITTDSIRHQRRALRLAVEAVV